MKAWITKYALTEGILEVEARVCSSVSNQMIEYRHLGSQKHAHGDGKDWHRTLEAALTRSEAMRTAKIASLRKKIAKLEKLSFAELA